LRELPPAIAAPAGKIRNVRPPVSPWFTWRDELLGQLDGAPGPVVALTAFAGQGGVGKSTVASAWADSIEDRYDIIWWVVAAGESPAPNEPPPSIAAGLTKLGRELGLTFADDEPAGERVERVLNELRSTSRSWAVIYDNANSVRSIHAWIARGGAGRSIVTTRSTDTAGLCEPLPVGCFPREIGGPFLQRRVATGNPLAAADAVGAADLSQFLGGLPLALEQAGAKISERGYSFAAYIERLRANLPEELRKAPLPAGYHEPAHLTSVDSIADAATADSLAPLLLAALSFIDPDRPFPLALLRATAPDPWTADHIDDAAAALVARSLLLRRGDSVIAHRLVQEASRSVMTTAEIGTAHSWIARSLLSIFSREFHTVAAACRALEPHAVAIVGPATVWNTQADLLANRLASWWSNIGDLGQAIALYRATLADRERVLGPDHPNTLTSRNNLALALWANGERGTAYGEINRAFDDASRALSEGHPLVAHFKAQTDEMGRQLGLL
jgi:Tetratricopeptide repeat/NB-ARC domain